MNHEARHPTPADIHLIWIGPEPEFRRELSDALACSPHEIPCDPGTGPRVRRRCANSRGRKIVLETRLEFVSSDRLRQIAENGAVGQVSVNSWLSR